MNLKIRKVPVIDTGLGQEAGYKNDAELIEAAQDWRAKLETLLTPEALARLDAAEHKWINQLIFGSQGEGPQP